MAVMRQFPPPLPSITPIGIFIHIAQVTNFVSNSGTWPVYDVTTQTLIEEDTAQESTTVGSGTTTTQTTAGTETSTSTQVSTSGGTTTQTQPQTQTQTQTQTTNTTPTPEQQSNADTQNNSQFDAILVGGLDHRVGDLNISRQENLFKEGFGVNTNVKAFRHLALTKNIKDFLAQNPKIPIFLFSAGCSKTLDLSRDPNVDKKLLFVIEPYGVSEPTKNLIETAIAEGLPAENVYVGSYPGVGSTIKGNTSKNPKGIGGSLGPHWGALQYVGSQKSNLAKTP
jgi:hypothetical protein